MRPLYTKTFGGKFWKICTAFSLTTFSAKNQKQLPLQFPAKSYLNIASSKKSWKLKTNFFPSSKKSDRTNLVANRINLSETI